MSIDEVALSKGKLVTLVTNKAAKDKGQKYQTEKLLTGESPKQLLARSQYIIYKIAHKWSPNQRFRSLVLFDRYPHLKAAYEHGQAFMSIYRCTCKVKTQQAFETWNNLTYEKKWKTIMGARNRYKPIKRPS